MKTFIVADESGIQIIFQTYEGDFFITPNTIGRLTKITEEIATGMIRKTPNFLI